MIPVKRQYLWGYHYRQSIKQSVAYYNSLNMQQPVWTRQLDQEEINQIFGGNPDYIKNIGRNDGKIWTLKRKKGRNES